MALWWSAQMSIQVTVRGLGGRTYLDKADWIYHADPQISTSMSLIHAISWFTIVAPERWKVEKISRFDSQCDLYWHVDLAFEIWSCSGLRHRASIFHGQSVHWREGVDRRARLEHYRLSYDVFAKRDVKLCRAMTLMTSLHRPWDAMSFESLSWGYCWRECGQGRVCQLMDLLNSVFFPPCHETLDRRVKPWRMWL